MNNNWVPTSLLSKAEQTAIPLLEGEVKIPFRRVRGFLYLSGMFFRFIGLKLIGRLDADTIGKHLGNFCQRMGVLWIKVGQLMSMRSDLFPVELCMQLARLQDRAEGFSPALVKKILQQQLGVPLERVFSSFEEIPCAAASIAQVHRATLIKDGVRVAIKVRRPSIDQVFTQDMAFIRKLFLMLHRFSIMTFMRWPDMLWELEQVFNEEMDYRYEISNQQRLRKTLSRHNIYVPRVYAEYSTYKVLTMEYIDGVPMADYLKVLERDPKRARAWLKENNIDSKKVGKALLQSYLRQVLEDNLFHADLHPGNIFLLRDSRIVLLDFGSTGSNEGDMLRKYDAYLEALSTGQYAKAIDLFLMIMPDMESGKLVHAKEELNRRLHAWDSRCRVREIPYKEKSTVMVSDEMTRVMARYGVSINWAFFKLLRGWTTMDASLRELIPDSDLPRMMRNYTGQRQKRALKKMIKQVPGDLLALQDLIDYPREFSEMAVYRGAAVRRLAQVFEGTATRVSRLAALGFEIGSFFAFFFSALFSFIGLCQHTEWFTFEPDHPVLEVVDVLPVPDPQVWALLIIISMYACISLAKLARRFRQQD